jgi:N-acetylglucosaminyldiphosphoundecaprenol N-acetyl-beta-D-mannosaminyltransferase
MRQGSAALLNVSAATRIATAIQPVGKGPFKPVDELLSARSCVISFVNAHAVNLACDDPNFFKVLMSADLLLRDGLGVQLLMRAIGRGPGMNMNGTDFIPRLLATSKSLPIALYGSSADVASAAAARLQNEGAVRVTHCDGFRAVEHYLQRIQEDQPRVVVLGMGMPKQELLADAIVKASTQPILVINGGAILDFMSGRIRRAPAPLRRFGLEWMFRLWLEPRRLWRRYLVGNAVFMARTCFAVLRYGRAPAGASI